MCGRFAASASTDTYVELFGVDEVVDEPTPTFNAAPTDPVAAVVDRVDKESGEVVRKLVTPRWGLVPSWSKDPSGGARLINARFETVTKKPSFRKAMAARRCLIPADGFYEWYAGSRTNAKGKPIKQPYFIHDAHGGPLVMAGLYEFWKNPELEGPESWLTTCTIITTAATDAIGRLHDRMPMTVRAADWDAWLDPALDDGARAKGLLGVAEPADLAAYPVTTRVNAVRNDGPELLDRDPDADKAGQVTE
ncbi:SOS response-associated peptidase [Nigerium massiliense]|uniref:SOS response-associated peptidase n=1 Tax=Nigerium massiliense TaxID=1522317 RepID=UPI00058C6D5A|nr:SOS response-associated peptidase [Nigerium massiliense]